MQIHLLYFGLLKDLLGHSDELLHLPENTAVSTLLSLLQTRASNTENGLWQSLAVAVNQEYARGSTVLKDGDEVALLPPVSGGRTAGDPDAR